MSNPTSTQPKDDAINWKAVSTVFIIFGLLSLLTSCVYGGRQYEMARQTYTNMVATDTLPRVGPINIKNGKQAVEVSIRSRISSMSWAFISGEVQDAKGEYLFGFGEELWHESGRDSDGAWTENKNSYSIDITFPDAGVYYLKFNYEGGNARGGGNASNAIDQVDVSVHAKKGSAIPHRIFGIIVLLIGLAIQTFARKHEIAEYVDKAERENAQRDLKSRYRNGAYEENKGQIFMRRKPIDTSRPS